MSRWLSYVLCAVVVVGRSSASGPLKAQEPSSVQKEIDDLKAKTAEIASLKLQIKTLQDQNSERARQMQLLEGQLQGLAQRTPPLDVKAQAKQAREVYLAYCATQGLRFDRLQVTLPSQPNQPPTRSILCK